MEKHEQQRPLVEAFDDDGDSDCESLRPTPITRHRDWIPKSLQYLLTALSIIASGLLGAYIARGDVSIDSQCAAYTTQYSPVLKDVNVQYSMTSFNGSFMKETIYRLPGSPEVDAAWEALGVDYRAGVISKDEGLASGLSTHHVQRAQKYGGGFFVNVEGMHHLHCLNLLRKALYFNIDYYKALGKHAFKNDDYILQLHVTHCLDTIRQVLMCNVDTGVLGQVWVDPAKPNAFPEFNTRHVCKNYDAVRSWAEAHQAPPLDQSPPDYLATPGADDIYERIP
ncbi:hypothetical protein BX600DRAFT_517261 [Xylariales sp. PMI_506]|nr:hypothetical protein BX600DRAFT_517261 [Xylariales sp. PMI_506]